MERKRWRVFSTPSTALSRLKRKVRWIEGGVETDTKVTEFGSYWRLHKAGELDSKVFTGRCFGYGSYYVPSDAWKRLITIEPKSVQPWRSPVTPMLQAVTSEPERVVVAGERDHKVFSDVPLYGSYFVPSSAYMRIYERYAVLDTTIREFRRRPVQFMGVGRYNFPMFTAWVDVRVNGRLNPWQAGFGYYGERRFWIVHDGTAIEEVRLACQAAKSLRDKIMLRSGPKPRFIAGGTPVLAGEDEVIVGRP